MKQRPATAEPSGAPLRLDALKDVVCRALSEAGPVSFVQVGAHDGVTGDPIHKFVVRHRWSGILIEPVRYLFEKLKRNYAGAEGLHFENICISETAGQVTFFTMRHMENPPTPHYTQLSSLDRSVILKYAKRLPDVAEHIEEVQVDSLPLCEVLWKHSLSPDVLVVDAEGYDLKVLRTLDFNQFRPALIYFEWKHLSRADRSGAEAMLKTSGYRVFTDGSNALALGPGISPELEAAFRPMRL